MLSEEATHTNFIVNTISYQLYFFPELGRLPLWPQGGYALPASIYGCPEKDWELRYINLTLPSKYIDMFWRSSGTYYIYDRRGELFTFNHTKDLHILGPYSERNIQLNFCVRGNDEGPNSISDLRGNFCIYNMEGNCSSGT